MTQEQKPKPRRTVTATVVGQGTYSNGKPKTDLDIPEWQSKFPFPCGTTPALQARMPVGATMRVALHADRLKEDVPEEYSPKPWDFFWSIVDLDPDQTIPELPPTAVTPTGTAPEQEQDLGWDDLPVERPVPAARSGYEASQAAKDRSIQRQVALKAAVDFCVGHNSNDDAVIPIAQTFFDWLAEEAGA